jgi:hypothetical protein
MSTKARYNNQLLEYFESTSAERVRVFSPVCFEDDFQYPSLVIPDSGSLESGVKWAKKIVGAAPPTVALAANSVNGAALCSLTAASQKQNADLYQADQLTFSVLQGLVFEARVALTTLPTSGTQAVWGVAGAWADGPDAITYSAWFAVSGSGAVNCESDDNVTDNTVTSGVTLTNADTKIFRIDCSDATSIKYYIDGAQVASATTFGWAANAANSKVQPYFSCYKASGTSVGVMNVDYVRCFQKRS